MKYIRTKDGRIITPIIKPDIFDSKDTQQGDNVISQADTIEELCDEFVYFEKENDYPLLCPNKETFDYWLKCKWKPYKCYGAIWTDKGLIYVAKMNSKGELELL